MSKHHVYVLLFAVSFWSTDRDIPSCFMSARLYDKTPCPIHMPRQNKQIILLSTLLPLLLLMCM